VHEIYNPLHPIDSTATIPPATPAPMQQSSLPVATVPVAAVIPSNSLSSVAYEISLVKSHIAASLEIEELKAKLSSATSEAESLRHQLSVAVKEVVELRSALADSGAEITVLKQNIVTGQSGEREFEDMKVQLVSTKNESDSLKSELSALQSRISTYDKDVPELKQKLDTSQKDVVYWKDAYSKSLSEVVAAQKIAEERAALLQSQSASHSINSLVEKKLSDAQKEVEELKTDLALSLTERRRVKDSADEQIGVLSNNLASQNQTHHKDVTELKSKLTSSQRHITTLKSQLAASQSQLASNSTSTATTSWAAEQLSSSRKEVAVLQSRLTTANGVIEALHGRINEIKLQHQKVEAHRNALEEDNKELLAITSASAASNPVYQLSSSGALCPIQPASHLEDSITLLKTSIRSVDQLIQFKSKATRSPAIYMADEDGALLPVFFEIFMEKLVLVDPNATLTTMAVDILLS
jgi:chromosome segregation ATPase